jgi:hypothetical protein
MPILALLALLASGGLWFAWRSAQKRSDMLAAMTPEEREAFLQAEADEEEARQADWDERLSADAIQQVAIARAERRAYARVWVTSGHVESVERWGARQGYTVLRAKTGKRTSDVQLSISGF